MKSTEFLKEENQYYWYMENMHDLSKEVVDIALAIKKYCQPYLKENKHPLTQYQLYRGLHSNKQVIHKQVRLNDRKPKDSSTEVHDALNKYFVKYYSEPFRNALFVMHDEVFVEDYGETYIVFPAGYYSYIWSPNIEDIYGEWQDKEYTESNDHFAKRIVTSGDYKTYNLIDGIKSQNEIMVRCKDYYGIKADILTDEMANIIEKEILFK